MAIVPRAIQVASVIPGKKYGSSHPATAGWLGTNKKTRRSPAETRTRTRVAPGLESHARSTNHAVAGNSKTRS
jgi:hypothetical protein